MIERNPDPMHPEIFRVQKVRHETEDTFTLELEPWSRAADFRFVAGQFNMLYVFGVGEIPVSISGDPGDPGRLFHTTRAVGTVTRATRRLKRGDAVGVRSAMRGVRPCLLWLFRTHGDAEHGGALGSSPRARIHPRGDCPLIPELQLRRRGLSARRRTIGERRPVRGRR